MLRFLSVRNILLIEHVDLTFGPGLNVLTGETGAGKSILLDALGFVLGWRGRAELVRSGAAFGEVTAQFDLNNDHPVGDVLAEAGIEFDGELILRRVNNPDGRKRSFLNDRPCSAEVLRKLSGALVEIHGQHDDRGLLDPKGHRSLLDEFAENQKNLVMTRQAANKYRSDQKLLIAAQDDLNAASEDAEYAKHSLAEMEVLAPKTGEDASLDAARRRMQSAERIRDDVEKGREALNAAESKVADGQRWLEDVSGKAEGGLDAAIDAMTRAMIEIAEAQDSIAKMLNDQQVNPYDLEQSEERLFAIRAAARKFDVLPDALPELMQSFRDQLDKIDLGSAHLADLETQVAVSKATYFAAADTLSARRRKAAIRLDKAMLTELAPLKMAQAKFTTVVSTERRDTPDPAGFDAVSFKVSTNPGAPAGPIDKIASGGELSRFLLALKVCLTTRADGLTLIFDEIDQGVGGATADAVGRRLAAVATDTQVLVVTHSPQVASLGETHFLVSKSVTKNQTTTFVDALSKDQRRNEIARMLAGDVVTDAARSAADALLSP